MNEQPKTKVLILLLGILLIANLVTLAFFITERRKNSKTERPDRKTYISAYLKNEIGFNEKQLAQYNSFGNRYLSEIKLKMNELGTRRKIIFKDLALHSFSDSAINYAAGIFAEQQKISEVNMLNYVKEIRGICTPSQLMRFDTGFYKILWKKRRE